MMNRVKDTPRGFAFVTMKDDGEIKSKILTIKHNIQGFVDVKLAENDQKRQEVEKSNKKIFVGGIEGSVSTEELRDYFSGFGRVKEAVVLRNMDTNQSRGFGFVTFEDEDVAENLVRENNFVLKGKNMDVKRAEPKTHAKQTRPTGQHQPSPQMSQQVQFIDPVQPEWVKTRIEEVKEFYPALT